MNKLALIGGDPITEKPFPSWPVFGNEEREGLLRVLDSGKWGSIKGDEVHSFEKRFADFHNAKYDYGVESIKIEVIVILGIILISIGGFIHTFTWFVFRIVHVNTQAQIEILLITAMCWIIGMILISFGLVEMTIKKRIHRQRQSSP